MARTLTEPASRVREELAKESPDLQEVFNGVRQDLTTGALPQPLLNRLLARLGRLTKTMTRVGLPGWPELYAECWSDLRAIIERAAQTKEGKKPTS